MLTIPQSLGCLKLGPQWLVLFGGGLGGVVLLGEVHRWGNLSIGLRCACIL